MRKRRVVGRIYGMKYSWKGHKDTRNRQKNRKKKRSGQAGLVYIKNVNRNGPTTWRWARGDHKTRHFENLRTEQWAHPIYKTSTSSKQKKTNKIDCVFAENWCFDEISSFTEIWGINCSLIYCERTSQRYYTLWSSQSENQLWCKQCTLVMVDIDETSKQNAGIY